jgi:hypothetical protein
LRFLDPRKEKSSFPTPASDPSSNYNQRVIRRTFV